MGKVEKPNRSSSGYPVAGQGFPANPFAVESYGKFGALMCRRFLLLLASTNIAAMAAPKPRIGDAEWMRRFRAFMKAFNEFVIALNDDIFDRAKWERVRSSWHRLEDD